MTVLCSAGKSKQVVSKWLAAALGHLSGVHPRPRHHFPHSASSGKSGGQRARSSVVLPVEPIVKNRRA
jgi:hypothetical protein